CARDSGTAYLYYFDYW
nr:immunoglobulin heavy chain junction region [Macaca mulatta]MPO14397.1 immunoglobulin heavy chain junction region [Macaca mulatta]MPO14410.1 immunoglobulin heavy chain junction region [Macaca mulatta]MPO14421.1 immunoglobulin heavy chain junction region [Macaca mulatta]MPO14422.1 immunoglobulin heavy chain junction region [Macaca mulatta]